MLTPKNIPLIAGLGSALLLVTALGFQAAGYAPCELCILQRWPHLAAAIIGGATLWLGPRRWLIRLGALAAAIATALAIYHTGVEAHWWTGPTSCTGGIGNFRSLSAHDLTEQLLAAPVVRCDEPALRIFGLTMANMNVIASGILTALWIEGLPRRR